MQPTADANRRGASSGIQIKEYERTRAPPERKKPEDSLKSKWFIFCARIVRCQTHRMLGVGWWEVCDEGECPPKEVGNYLPRASFRLSVLPRFACLQSSGAQRWKSAALHLSCNRFASSGAGFLVFLANLSPLWAFLGWIDGFAPYKCSGFSVCMCQSVAIRFPYGWYLCRRPTHWHTDWHFAHACTLVVGRSADDDDDASPHFLYAGEPATECTTASRRKRRRNANTSESRHWRKRWWIDRNVWCWFGSFVFVLLCCIHFALFRSPNVSPTLPPSAPDLRYVTFANTSCSHFLQSCPRCWDDLCNDSTWLAAYVRRVRTHTHTFKSVKRCRRNTIFAKAQNKWTNKYCRYFYLCSVWF